LTALLKRIVGVAECRYESLIATLVAEVVCKSPLPENHTDKQQRRLANIFYIIYAWRSKLMGSQVIDIFHLFYSGGIAELED